MMRNQVSKETAQQWINSQMPLEQKEAIADVVLHNDGTLEDLHIKTTNAWSQLINKLRAKKDTDQSSSWSTNGMIRASPSLSAPFKNACSTTNEHAYPHS